MRLLLINVKSVIIISFIQQSIETGIPVMLHLSRYFGEKALGLKTSIWLYMELRCCQLGTKLICKHTIIGGSMAKTTNI